MRNLNPFSRIGKRDTLILACLLMYRVAFFFFACNPSLTWDSYEFINADGLGWLVGNPDRYRLPLYSMLLDIAQALFGSSGQTVVFLSQLTVGMLSTLAMYSLLRKLTQRPGIYLPVLVFSSIALPMLGWDKILLTESLSLSLTIFLLWALVSYLKENQLRHVVFATIFVGLGALLRATFALYAGAFSFFLLLRAVFPGAKEDRQAQRRNDLKGLAISAVSILLILCYAAGFHARHNAFNLSDSGLGQQLCIVIKHDYYLDGGDSEIIEDIEHLKNTTPADTLSKDQQKLLSELLGTPLTLEETQQIMGQLSEYAVPQAVTDPVYMDTLNNFFNRVFYPFQNPEFLWDYLARCYIMETYDRDRVAQFVDEAKAANLTDYLKQLPDTLTYSFRSGYTVRKNNFVARGFFIISDTILSAVNINLLHISLAALAELGLYLYLLFKKKRSHWMHLGFGALMLATVALSVFGTNAEFCRTAITALPMFFAVIAIWADRLAAKLNNK